MAAMPWPAAPGSGWPDIGQALRRVPRSVVRGALVAGVLGILALFGAVAFIAPSAQVSPAVHTPSAGELGTVPARPQCDGCGVVEGIKLVQGVDNGPATFAFSVRMKDGSLRDSVTATAGSWRVGDHIILMGGTGHP
jgi:hypothetical protein